MLSTNITPYSSDFDCNLNIISFLQSISIVDYPLTKEVLRKSEDKFYNTKRFLGEFNDALNILYKAQKIYKNVAEIEYRLAGLFFVLNKEIYGLHHLISAMKIDYEYHIILNELFPTVYENKKVQKLLSDYKKAME